MTGTNKVLTPTFPFQEHPSRLEKFLLPWCTFVLHQRLKQKTCRMSQKQYRSEK